MRRVESAASLIWGAFLAFALLGSALDGSVGPIVYCASALAAWGWCFARWRRWIAIPLSLLGPLAIVPVALRGWRKGPLPRPAKPKRVEPAARAPRRPPLKHPRQTVAAMLIGSVLVFPVAGIVLLTLIVLGGAHFVTASDIRGISIASGVLAGCALVATALVWREHGGGTIGWLLIALAALPIAAMTWVFTQGTSPDNLSRPSVSGRAEVGSLLTGDAGRWRGPGRGFSFTYHWQDCDPACTDIYGATDRTYSPARSDLHMRIRLSVTASPNHGGALDFDSSWAYSRETVQVVP
jgi:hypothetical protein